MKIAILIISLALFGCQKEQKIEKQFSDRMQTKIEDDIKRDDITGRIHVLFRSVDNKDWNSAKEILTEQVDFDMGEGQSSKSADEVLELWKKATEGVDTHHEVGNYGIEINGANAKLTFLGTITHFKKLKSGKNTRTLYGSYEVHMSQPAGDPTNWAWKVTKFKYVNKFTDGNVNLK